MSKSDVRPTALLYERYVYHARGLDGATDIKGLDQPVLRQRFRYYGPRMVPVIDPETGLPTNTLEERQVEVFAPGMGALNELTPQNCYTRVDQETVYYVQNLRGDVVSLASEEFVGDRPLVPTPSAPARATPARPPPADQKGPSAPRHRTRMAG